MEVGELLTAEQVLDEMETYCKQHNALPVMPELMRRHYAKYHSMAPAVIHDLKLEPIQMWRRKEH